eukprot:TRINITY_DN2640_c0_g1_i3.p1 TRINITY_DN2640_c0_g1~~TRINITY_DN2640_c0_g1_i3.p1  ORF type:complete len:261 (+),score=86.75 TRINITY_DN2640_c0_g1_i3:24-785(+)
MATNMSLENGSYYSTIDLNGPQPTARADWSVAAKAALMGAALVMGWSLGAALATGSAGAATTLRSTTLDVGVSQGSAGLEAGLEVSETGERQYRAAAVGQGPLGRWRAAASRGDKGPITQTLDYSRKEGRTAFKLGLRRVGQEAWKWRAGTETLGEYTFKGGDEGGDSAPAAAGDDASKMMQSTGGRPVIVTAAVGTVHEDIKIDAGIKAVDGDIRLRGGIQGGGKGNSWGLGIETPSKDQKGTWRVVVNTGN